MFFLNSYMQNELSKKAPSSKIVLTIKTHFLDKFKMLFVNLIYDLQISEKNIGIIGFSLTSIITLIQQSPPKAHMHIWELFKKNIRGTNCPPKIRAYLPNFSF